MSNFSKSVTEEGYRVSYGADDFVSLTATGTDFTVYNVTSTKIFYLKEIICYNDAGSTAVITIYRSTGGAAADIKFQFSVGTKETAVISLNSPIVFDGASYDVIARTDNVTGGNISLAVAGNEV